MSASISSMMPNVNVDVSLGGMSGTPSSNSFDSMAGSPLSSNFGLGANASADSSFASQPQSNMDLAKELLQQAEQSSSPSEKSDLIKAAIDLMGGGGTAAPPATAQTAAPSTTPAAIPDTTTPSTTTPSTTPSSTASSDPSSSSSGLTVSGNSIDTGRYVISGSTNQDGSLTIYDKQTNTTDTVWGDPHVNVNGQDVADFQKNGLTLNLPDGTKVEMKPTGTDGDGKSHLDQAVVSKDGQAVSMSGFTGGGGVQTGTVQQDSEGLEQSAMTPGETVLDAGNDGLDDLHYTNADGSQGAQLSLTSGEQDLDGSGGADPSTAATPTATGGANDTGSNTQLATQLLQQAEQSTDPQTQNDLIQAAMDLMGGGSTPASGLSSGQSSAASDLNSLISTQISSPTAQMQAQNDLATLLQGAA